ncbi:TPA: phage tail protein [Citrobacter youngae]|nr:phage tail protein [Citrobacter youngae]HEF0072759.1 phage tail protein [Citrobacter youngae]
MALSLLAANNAQTVLAAGISSTATSLTVNAGTGTLFPSPVAGTSFFKLTIIDAATGSLTEIIHVTARNGDVFTIQRGQEGTVPRAWSANDIAANMMTAGTLSYILGNFQPLDPTLTALATLVGAANKLPYFNGDDTAALTDFTQVGRDIIGKNTIADILTYLGLGAGAPAIGIPFFWPSAVMPNTVIDEWSDMVFLKFNNSTFSATTYPKLALVYPGLTLIDQRGEFIRIWDDGRGVDSGRALLSAQDASAINLLLGENSNQPGLGQIAVSNDDGQNVSSGWSVAKNPEQIHNSDGVNFAKVRPRNIAWNFLVRAK